MRKRLSIGGALAQLVLALGALTVLGSGSAPALVAPLGAGEAKAAKVDAAALRRLPLSFVENRGQTDRRVAYYVQGTGASVYFTRAAAIFSLTKRANQNARRPLGLDATRERGGRSLRWAVRQEFVDANPAARPRGQGRTQTRVSYFKGPRSHWKTGLPAFSRVVYRNLWPGIDLVYSGKSSRLEYSFLVRPGADPGRIRLAYRGASSIRLNRAGQLEVSTKAGGFRDDRPFAYQRVDGRRVGVPVAFALQPNAHRGRRSVGYGFRLGAYDRSKPLVLDPAVLVYAGYIGGDGSDFSGGIALDAAGNAYVTGNTLSTEASFPVTGGPDLTYNDAGDAFVAKVNPAGTALVYAGYIGGSGSEGGIDVAVDGAGNAYVTGATDSTESSFPVTVGPDLTYSDGTDAFVAKVNAAGTALVYAGYIGGSCNEDVFAFDGGIAVDGSGSAYVTGTTRSGEDTFPVKVGPDLTFNGTPCGVDANAFVAKVNPAGSSFVYAGYVGGGADLGTGIAVDSSGSAYLSGVTASDESTFPVTVGPDLSFNGTADAFVAKVNPAGTALEYAGYIGGSGSEIAVAIALDDAGNAYVAGYTRSTEGTFPVTRGPDTSFNGGDQDAYVAKVSAAGTELVYAGYIGGDGSNDYGLDVAVDPAGNAYVTGETDSTEATFPVTGGPDLTSNGADDAFVAKVNASGAGLSYAGYIGGSDTDGALGIAVDGNGDAYVAGSTLSTEASFPVAGGPDLTYNGGFFDAFVAKVGIPCTITGTSGSDTLNGTPGDDVICGLGGNDKLNGRGGDDILLGGDGRDTLDGGTGNDVELAGSGNDTLLQAGPGPNGADALSGGNGTDAVSYAGRDASVAISLDGVANDGAIGEEDSVAADVEKATGGFGNDTIVGSAANNTLSGGPGNDFLSGLAGKDTLAGGTGDDVENGGDGDDIFNQEKSANGADALNGATGKDTVKYAGRSADVSVSLDGVADDGAAGEGDNVGLDVENVTGGSGGDTLVGSSVANTLVGGLGGDNLSGQDGDDNLKAKDGIAGNDTVDGGAGTDKCTSDPGDAVTNCP